MSGQSVDDSETEDGESADGDVIAEMAREGGFAFGAGIFNKGVGFVFQVLLARFLGPAGYGLYVLGWTVVHYVQPFIFLGLLDGIVRFIPDYLTDGDHRRVRGTIYAALGITVSLALVAAVGVYGLAGTLAERVFGSPEFTPVLRLFALTVPLYVLMHVTTAVAVGFKQVKYQQSIKNVLFPVLKVSLIGALFLSGYRLVGAVYGLLVALVVSAGVGVLSLPRVLGDVDAVGPAEVELRALLRYSIPLLFVGFSEMAIHQTDRLLLGALGTSAQVGLYNAAYVLSQQTIIFFTAMMTIFNPVVADLYSAGDHDQLQTVYESVTRWILIVSLPVVVFGSTFAPELLTIFNPAFRDGSFLLLLLLIAQLVFVSVGPAREVLVMSDHQDIVLVDTLALLGVNIGLNLVLIPRFGAVGAAVATIVTIGIVQLVQVYQAAQYVGVFPFNRVFFRVLAIGVPFASLGYVTWYLSTSLVLRIGLAIVMGGAYAATIWTYAVTSEDVRIVRELA
jgi:O-antigen/teichoic acid export membrane protein